MEASQDASDDFCYRGCRPDYGRNLFVAFAIPFNRSIGRCDADIGGAPQDGRCKRAPGTGNRGSIAGLSNGDETLKSAPQARRKCLNVIAATICCFGSKTDLSGMSAFGRYCCKSPFASATTNCQGRTRGDRMII